MASVLIFAPVVIIALALQFGISASWSMPWFRYGLPLYRRPLPIVHGRTTAEIVEAIRGSKGFSLAYRQLSADEIGLRCNLLVGFTGVQARIVNAQSPVFVARLGWPALVAYAFFLVVTWTF